MRFISAVVLAASTLFASAQEAAPKQPVAPPALTQEETQHMRAISAESAAYDLGAQRQAEDTAKRLAQQNAQKQKALSDEREQLIEQINKAHSGWHWVDDRSEATGHLEPVAAAKPAEAVKK